MTEFEKLVLERFDRIDNQFKEMNNVQLEILNRQDKMEREINQINSTIDKDIYPSIKLLSEMQIKNYKRLIRLEKDVQDITDNIAIDEVLQGINAR